MLVVVPSIRETTKIDLNLNANEDTITPLFNNFLFDHGTSVHCSKNGSSAK
jgi:hypothetical protein